MTRRQTDSTLASLLYHIYFGSEPETKKCGVTRGKDRGFNDDKIIIIITITITIIIIIKG